MRRCRGAAYLGRCPVSRLVLGSGDRVRLAFTCRGGAPPAGGRWGRATRRGGSAPPRRGGRRGRGGVGVRRRPRPAGGGVGGAKTPACSSAWSARTPTL